MAISSIQYETALAACTEHAGAIALLRQYRPYLEAIPSMRRPDESIVTLPLPNVQVREAACLQGQSAVAAGATVTLPCDLAFLMCDPEWKIKTGIEIFVFIHRPHEDFSKLLMRWRQTQVLISSGYEWQLPPRYQHLLNDGAEACHPLFVLFPQSPQRLLKGLQGAALPAVVYPLPADAEGAEPETSTLEFEPIPGLDEIDAGSLEIPDSE